MLIEIPSSFATAEVVLRAKECAGTERGLGTEDGGCRCEQSIALASRFLFA